MSTDSEDNADILESSLQLLYGFTPIVHSSAGSIWTYTGPIGPQPRKQHLERTFPIRLRVPNTSAKNWSLHAGSVWVAAVFLADQISSDDNWLSSTLSHLDLSADKKARILEIGAGAGLPSILLTKLHRNVISQVVVSDYPDDGIMHALRENISMNFDDSDLSSNSPSSIISVAPFDWLDLSPPSFDIERGFDLVIGADVLWNSELHLPMLLAVERCLRKKPGSLVLFVAGLHTGRYTIQRFLDRVYELESRSDLRLKTLEEREVNGNLVREWDAQRGDTESEEERRRWIVRICLVQAIY